MIFECDDCGMQNEQAALQWDDVRRCHVCPDCGSPNLSEATDDDEDDPETEPEG